jgi:hypothetical protein
MNSQVVISRCLLNVTQLIWDWQNTPPLQTKHGSPSVGGRRRWAILDDIAKTFKDGDAFSAYALEELVREIKNYQDIGTLGAISGEFVLVEILERIIYRWDKDNGPVDYVKAQKLRTALEGHVSRLTGLLKTESPKHEDLLKETAELIRTYRKLSQDL